MSLSMPRRWLAALRGSMSAQISVAITLVSVLLVASSNWLVLRMTTQELRQGSEMVMLANIAFLHEDLTASGFEIESVAHALANRIEAQLGSLHVALLDEQRRVIAASDYFQVPISALPREALRIGDLPTGVTHEKVQALQRRLGPLTTMWKAPDGRVFRLMLCRVTVPEQFPAATQGPVLVALAFELSHARDVVVHGWKVLIVALVLSAAAAAVIGVSIANRIVIVARRLGTAASRISGHALHERLRLDRTPTELLESGEAFNRMLDRLEAAFKRLSEFSSDLAHDLRTPINNLLGEAQVTLSRPRSAEEYRAALESAVEDYERISRLIENMLFLARAEDAQASIHREWIDLRTASERVRDYFEGLADERGVSLGCELRGDDAAHHRVWADKTLLLRAVSNLISNALRYAPRGTSVLLCATSHEGGACTLEVSNEGPAIAPKDQPRLFDRLFRVDASREGSGSGLGLAIVKSIMDLHGGDAAVRSHPGERTAFSLRFPGPGPAEA
ncbi:heavy metal sensor histidine kinase [Piscinibacter sp. XHJ-5]|uniref:heavy metal sensor histidine kinase n=1 Tax=Piscinibacter sp. XHJ-5 TaxID=3037797 RepID=UPI002453195E|nr:heavy metal sensor histidine kinase [Piscinibacter sp. XHJ-5]